MAYEVATYDMTGGGVDVTPLPSEAERLAISDDALAKIAAAICAPRRERVGNRGKIPRLTLSHSC